MPDLNKYPFRTARTIDGKTYISVEELNEILNNLERLGPTFKQIADATSQMKQVFGDTRKTVNLLTEELRGAEGKV